MSATVTYKGNTLTTVNNETKILETAGTWLEDDITIVDVNQPGEAIIVDTEDAGGGTIREITTGGEAITLQNGKTVTLTMPNQTIYPDAGYDGFTSVTVDASSISGGNKWVRPADWPDIESLVPFGTAAFDSFDGVYFTLDNTGNHAPWVCFWATTSSGKFVMERGHIANGAFVTDASYSINSNSDKTECFSECGYDYPVYYIHAETSGEHLTALGFRTVNTNVSGLPSQFYGTETGCLDMVGHIAYCGHEGGNGSDRQRNCKCTVHEHLVFGDKIVITSLRYAFCYMSCLEELDFTGFDTSLWEITDMSMAFNGCSVLKRLDMSGLDKSKWALTASGLNYCFYGLGAMEYLDISGEWDTENFSLTTMNTAFSIGQNLRYCNISPLVYTGTTNISYPRSQNLREYYPMTLYGGQNYSDSHNLSRASLLRIIDSLPNGNYTLSLSRTNLAKLTAEEIAVATNKGWTVN